MVSFLSRTKVTCSSVLLIAAISLFGCATPGSLVPQQSSAANARDRVGLPTDIRFDANGEELWEYARGPAGMQTDLVRIGRDGKVKDVTQLLTPERFDRIIAGKTTKQQMRDLLGRPSDLHYLPSGLVWEWRARVGPENGHYAVRFDDRDIVREKMVLIDPHSDDGKGGGGK